MTIRKTTPTERLDMMLVQAEQFLALGNPEEAAARARAVVAYALRERAMHVGEALRREIDARARLGEQLLASMGQSVRDARGHLSLGAEDSQVARAWA